MTSRRTWLILALLVVVVLALLFVAPAHAHGGEGDELQRPAALWMVGMIYIQLLLIPVVGLWLAGEALAAWRPRKHKLNLDFENRPRGSVRSRKES